MGSTLTHHISRRVHSHPVRGFSVIEVLIALGIVSVIMAVAVSGNSSFNKSLLLSQAAYSIATTIQEAQSLGVANQNINLDLNTGYGFYIHIPGSTGTREYSIFADVYPTVAAAPQYRCHQNDDYRLPDAKPGDCHFNSDYDTLVRTYSLKRDISITAFCGTRADGYVICTPITHQSQTCASGSEGGITELSVVFARPSTGAILRGKYYNGFEEEFVSATLAVQSVDNSVRYVTIRDTGQVSVHTTCS